MAEEWVKDARNKVRLANNLSAETNKTTAESKNKKLALKLAAAGMDRKRTEAGLKSAEAQAEEKRKKLYYVEIERALMALKADLEKVKEAALAAKADLKKDKGAEQKFYELGVQETETHLTEELAKIYRDYCQEV